MERQTFYCKVASFEQSNEERITWEPESSLPQSLIDEYESRATGEELVTDSQFDIRSQTIVMGKKNEGTPPKNKKSRLETDKGQEKC